MPLFSIIRKVVRLQQKHRANKEGLHFVGPTLCGSLYSLTNIERRPVNASGSSVPSQVHHHNVAILFDCRSDTPTTRGRSSQSRSQPGAAPSSGPRTFRISQILARAQNVGRSLPAQIGTGAP